MPRASSSGRCPKADYGSLSALLALAVEHNAAHDGKWAQTTMRPRVVTKRPITVVAATSIDSACASGRHSIQQHTHAVLLAAWPLAIFLEDLYASDLSILCHTDANRSGYYRRLGSTGRICQERLSSGVLQFPKMRLVLQSAWRNELQASVPTASVHNATLLVA